MYDIYILLHRSDLKISAKNCQHFFANELMNLIQNFRFFSFSASNFAFFLRILDELFSGFRDKFQKTVTSVVFQSNLRNIMNCWKFWNMWKLFNIIQYYSIVSLGVTLGQDGLRDRVELLELGGWRDHGLQRAGHEREDPQALAQLGRNLCLV